MHVLNLACKFFFFSAIFLFTGKINVQGQCLNNFLNITTQKTGVSIGDLDIIGNKVTVEAIFNRTRNYSGTYIYAGDLVSKHSDPTNINYLLRPNNAEITTTNGYFVTPSVCNIDTNKTYHVAMVYDGTKLMFYRNGFLLSSVNATGNLITNNFSTTIGTSADLSTIFNTSFIGQINEVRIWTVARTAQQIKAYVNTSLPSPTSQVGLQAYYIFNSLNNLEGNSAWNATIIGNASINSANPTCATFSADSCSLTAAQIGIKQGLMAYYPFNGNAGDSSGNANHPIFNNATLADDRFGKPNRAYYFNGINNYMRIPNSNSLNSDSAVTVALWVKVKGFYQGLCHGNYMLIKGYDNIPGVYAAVYSDAFYTNQQSCNTSTVYENFQQFYGTGAPAAPNNYIQKDTWYFVTFTASDTVSKLYINGVLQSSKSYSTKFTFRNNYDLFLGRYIDVSVTGYWINATLDDIRLYNKALSADELSLLYNENKEAPAPLPVNLTSFSASKNQNDVLLNWSVSGETNHHFYAIERSVNNNNFTEVGRIASTNSSVNKNYSYTDKSVFDSYKTASYRLKMVDLDGSFTYSNTISINNNDRIATNSSIIFPNPVNNTLTVTLDVAKKTNVKFRVIDITGKEILSQQQMINAGKTVININEIGSLQPGSYVLQIVSENSIENKKFLKL